MNRYYKFLSSFLSYKLHHLIAGTTIKPTIFPELITNVKIKNKKLAEELENACKNNNGYLTYAEFSHISQYGTYGYHKTHNHHGMTDTYRRWGDSLVKLCKEKQYHDIVELGCGNGRLGVETIRFANTINYNLTWHGIDISKELLIETKKRFQREKIDKNLGQLVTDIQLLSLTNPFLFVCSYSLDSIPPEVFINTRNSLSYPNAIIGIQITKGMLSEVILPKNILAKKNISMHNGIFTFTGTDFDISSWKLEKNQRMYIPIQSFLTLKKSSEKIPKNSTITIIDEFCPAAYSWKIKHIASPQDLDKYDPVRECLNPEVLYKDAGNMLLYYPFFLSAYISALFSLGYSNITYESEHFYSQHIVFPKNYRIFCFAVTGVLCYPPSNRIVVKYPVNGALAPVA